MQKVSARVGALFGSCLLLACGGEPGIDLTAAEASAGTEDGNICYRGQRRLAERIGEYLVIEGDILVGEADQWCDDEGPGDSLDPSGDEPVGTQTHGTRRTGGFNWVNGRILFKVSPLIPANQLTNINLAMDNWEAAVPGILFVSAGFSAFHYIDIVPDTSQCASGVGFQHSAQKLLLMPSCGQDDIEHELGHAMGLYHEQSRKDRDQFVTVNWGLIRGCPNAANGPEDCTFAACSASLAMATECDCPSTLVTDPEAAATVWPICSKGHNFERKTDQSDIGDYNLTSLMHYPATGFRKSGRTGNTLDSIPPGLPMSGNVISEDDARSMQAMYPVLTGRTSAFVTANVSSKVCDLLGREEDAATQYRVAYPGPDRDTGAYSFLGNHVTFSADVGITQVGWFCDGLSYFWGGTYDYPNSSTANYKVVWEAEERFDTDQVNAVLMTSALVPILL